MKASSTQKKEKPNQHNEDEYEMFLETIQTNLEITLETTTGSLFTTDAANLFKVFLDNLPEEVRQHYTCNACRHFVDRYGGVVAISPEGKAIPAVWPEGIPELYQKSVQAIRAVVSKARVTGVFYNREQILGQPVTGGWHHMAITMPSVWKHPIQTAFQGMAEKKEDYRTLIAGLLEFPPEAVEQAIKLLKTDSLYRSEKCLGVAEWLREVHEKRASTKNSNIKANLTWLAVACAPPGFCHIKSTMIGTLLEDIVAGLPYESIAARFAEKMNPLRYQRPQAPPSSGNIAQAEKIIRQLNASGSLARRYARLEEVQTIWTPQKLQDKTDKREEEGVFSHLQPKNDKALRVSEIDMPPILMTWEKFYRNVLPEAIQIHFRTVNVQTNYSALVTAVDMDAPPIIVWDFEDRRNPVTWYLWHGGSLPSQWGLVENSYCPVSGICFQPSMWDIQKSFTQHGESVFFLLEGARDSKNEGLALFPEFLKSEFHSIRSTIEAFSQSKDLEGAEEASACGLKLEKGRVWSNAVFRVTLKNGDVIFYKLDRWD